MDSFVTKLRVGPYPGALEALRQLRLSPTNWPADLDAPVQQAQLSSSMSTANGLNSPMSEPDPASCIQRLAAFGLARDRSSSPEEPYHLALAETDQGGCCDQSHCTLDPEPASPLDTCLRPTQKFSDPRLKGLEISFWTDVEVTDIFATHAISSYLRSDHRIWELFDADPFLSDLVAQKSNFCSAFLVNCLLAFASVRHPFTLPPASREILSHLVPSKHIPRIAQAPQARASSLRWRLGFCGR